MLLHQSPIHARVTRQLRHPQFSDLAPQALVVIVSRCNWDGLLQAAHVLKDEAGAARLAGIISRSSVFCLPVEDIAPSERRMQHLMYTPGMISLTHSPHLHYPPTSAQRALAHQVGPPSLHPIPFHAG